MDAAVLSALLRGLRFKPLNKEIQGATGVSPSTIYNGLRALTANSEFMSALKSELIKVRAQAAANSGSQQLGDSPGSLTQQTRGDSSIPNNSSSPYHYSNSASTIASNTASLPQKSSPSRGIKRSRDGNRADQNPECATSAHMGSHMGPHVMSSDLEGNPGDPALAFELPRPMKKMCSGLSQAPSGRDIWVGDCHTGYGDCSTAFWDLASMPAVTVELPSHPAPGELSAPLSGVNLSSKPYFCMYMSVSMYSLSFQTLPTCVHISMCVHWNIFSVCLTDQQSGMILGAVLCFCFLLGCVQLSLEHASKSCRMCIM